MKHTLLVILFLLVTKLSFGQIDTIAVAKGDLVTANLKPGLHQYLVYFENPAKKRIGHSSIWNRNVEFKKWNGRDVILIEQYWYSNDTTFNRYVLSVADKKTFAPIFHKTKMKGEVEAFDFDGKRISGSDSIANNVKKDLDVPLEVATLNWELDLETFSTLPIKKEQRFIVNFYHPGGKTSPKYYEYAIVGSEKISGVNDAAIDCWKMKINYTANDWAVFWISKKSKEVIKMQEHFRGGYRYKVRFATPIESSK